MTDMEQRKAAKKFAADWKNRGDEKQETQAFWMALLQKVYGVAEPDKFIDFEVRVKLDHTSFIDGFIPATRVLIEQKGQDIDLHKGYRQSDGSLLTPYQQARRYAGYLPHDRNPRWIVVCNFREFHIHDMNRPNDAPEIVLLSALDKEYHRMNFLVDTGDENIRKEMEVSLKAGELVGQLYDALLKQYAEPDNPETLKSLNALCVRLVFCLYAEDAGIFGGHGKFHNYLQNHRSEDRRALINLFRVLDQKPEERDRYLDEDLAVFPYVNGGLFADENIEIPRLGDAIIDLILRQASEDFDWSVISPTIFGAVFESTLNPETRRAGGMHYTSIENIHKVIDPLFLEELRNEFEEIAAIAVDKTRDAKLRAFQQKLAGLTFLDPACGSGNFLTETYISLRRLENEVISLLQRDQMVLGETINPIQVSIGQFYGIEINDFAVTVAKTALWIAESQMMKETEDIVHMVLDFLPLKTNAHIVEGNALRMDWEDVVPKHELDYIMGNPPFVGVNYMSDSQRVDMDTIWLGTKRGKLDYVTCWYVKASELMKNTPIKTALVSTNSVTQGEQASSLWKKLFSDSVHINFAHRTFQWDSETNQKAHVHVVIIGFSCSTDNKEKQIFDSGIARTVKNINGYLLDAPTIIIEERSSPLCDVPAIVRGSQATDNGFYLFTAEEKNEFLTSEPQAEKYFKRFMMGREFINNIERWCLWMPDISPSELRSCPKILERVQRVKEFRLASKNAQTKQTSDIPWRFGQYRPPASRFIAFAKVSSEKRRYVPFGFLTNEVIPGDKLFTIPNATIYMFGVLTSNVHMAWMRTVCGRLEMRYSYSTTIVYNNFPWPTPTEEQKAKIEQTAQAILDARALYPDCSLADLYDEVTMPPELRKAHQQNDRAVWEAYGKCWDITSETACVAELMKMYQELTK